MKSHNRFRLRRSAEAFLQLLGICLVIALFMGHVMGGGHSSRHRRHDPLHGPVQPRRL